MKIENNPHSCNCCSNGAVGISSDPDVGGSPHAAIELSECPAYALTESGGGQRREEEQVH